MHIKMSKMPTKITYSATEKISNQKKSLIKTSYKSGHFGQDYVHGILIDLLCPECSILGGAILCAMTFCHIILSFLHIILPPQKISLFRYECSIFVRHNTLHIILPPQKISIFDHYELETSTVPSSLYSRPTALTATPISTLDL